MDEGDVERGLHGWLVEAREGLPGVCSLHLCRGDHPAQTRTSELVLGDCLRPVRVGGWGFQGAARRAGEGVRERLLQTHSCPPRLGLPRADSRP